MRSRSQLVRSQLGPWCRVNEIRGVAVTSAHAGVCHRLDRFIRCGRSEAAFGIDGVNGPAGPAVGKDNPQILRLRQLGQYPR